MRFILSVCALLLGMKAHACDCAEPPAPKKALDGAGAVFLGEAGKVAVEGDTRIVTFKVERWWKGGDKQEVTVNTHKDGATCGYNFEKGKKYLVYARAEKDKPLRVSLCSRTRLEKVAEESGDFKELGEGKKPVALGEPQKPKGLAAAIAEASHLEKKRRAEIEYLRTIQRAYEAWQNDNNRPNRELLERIPSEPRELFYRSPK